MGLLLTSPCPPISKRQTVLGRIHLLNILSSTTSLRSLLSSIRQFTSCCQLTPSDNFQRPESSAAVIQAAMPGIHYTAPKLGRRSKRSVTAQP
ncbi:hypothetical protein PC111_g16251 [Phytophthora cactorum]|nr:hypothetical protein PC111_g16251 [Phytophthora cactorum]KAG2827789.1 hypothetical protein PC112_g8705 [Phytophthora cactorum]KAG3006713.1 hypothetical protein PC120_g17192 [Phytophthora cactorum]